MSMCSSGPRLIARIRKCMDCSTALTFEYGVRCKFCRTLLERREAEEDRRADAEHERLKPLLDGVPTFDPGRKR